MKTSSVKHHLSGFDKAIEQVIASHDTQRKIDIEYGLNGELPRGIELAVKVSSNLLRHHQKIGRIYCTLPTSGKHYITSDQILVELLKLKQKHYDTAFWLRSLKQNPYISVCYKDIIKYINQRKDQIDSLSSTADQCEVKYAQEIVDLALKGYENLQTDFLYTKKLKQAVDNIIGELQERINSDSTNIFHNQELTRRKKALLNQLKENISSIKIKEKTPVEESLNQCLLQLITITSNTPRQFLFFKHRPGKSEELVINSIRDLEEITKASCRVPVDNIYHNY